MNWERGRLARMKIDRSSTSDRPLDPDFGKPKRQWPWIVFLVTLAAAAMILKTVTGWG